MGVHDSQTKGVQWESTTHTSVHIEWRLINWEEAGESGNWTSYRQITKPEELETILDGLRKVTGSDMEFRPIKVVTTRTVIPL